MLNQHTNKFWIYKFQTKTNFWRNSQSGDFFDLKWEITKLQIYNKNLININKKRFRCVFKEISKVGIFIKIMGIAKNYTTFQ